MQRTAFSPKYKYSFIEKRAAISRPFIALQDRFCYKFSSIPVDRYCNLSPRVCFMRS